MCLWVTSRQVLFSSERNCWPDKGVAPLYPLHATHPESPYRFLNSGAYAGSVAALRALFDELGAAAAPLDADDQRLFTTYYLLSRGRAGAPPLALDAGARLFHGAWTTLARSLHAEAAAAAP